MTRPELESLFLAQLPVIERILGALARRHALGRDEGEEFSAWAKSRLIEGDYAVFAKFRGESSVSTYLTVVLAMLFREYRVAEWGRWRPSAAARRGGALAIRLEALVQRDGLSVSHAGQVLRTAGQTTLNDRELSELVATFPRRFSARPVPLTEAVAEPVAPASADELVADEEAATESTTATQLLGQALDALPTEERLIVRMHYMEDMSVADIARGLSIPQKPLYRRLERSLRALRIRLESAGVSHEIARQLATGPP